MSTSVPRGDGQATGPAGRSLTELLDELPALDEATVVHSTSSTLTLAELRAAVSRVAGELTRAGVRPGHPVGALVGSGASGVVAMFAAWRAGAVYMPVNHRMTGHEVAALIDDTPVCLLLGTTGDLEGRDAGIGVVELDETTWSARTRRPVPADATTYDDDIALVLRTSGTTGKPKAVLLRHDGTLDALDASLRKLRRRTSGPREPRAELRANLIPLSLALWAGIFNTLFSFRAGFGVVLLDRFTPEEFASAVREHELTSTVLAPAMITMLSEADEVDTLEPLQIVRSITAPLSPAVAQRFHDRYGVLVLNSYGQTELGGEVVGWTIEDIRTYGTEKLGAVGRPYDDVDVRILDEHDQDLPAGEPGHIHVRSPYRMRGYAVAGDEDADRMLDGFLRTGDVGRLDADGFLWIEGRVSDMINRGGLKVFPDEVEEVLRRHPSVRDAAVAGVPDRRLGEVPCAWIVPVDGEVDEGRLTAWCREHLAPYKVPVSFVAVDAMPRNDVGKVLRRQLRTSAPPKEVML
ncbi:class I adenylate-forming enzyme family protein [Nonomuraea sp. C10]|uniref:class I adenylate-forming enzyme family protein n=1 Tax=Nonomuraea sp. C10 TaxID=2600577 RepID=UPI0011CE4AA3|nr:AMP-binding protein [Nonomuraea sp. C10]TXK34386.1 long-chain fatty acid--CoA ligase [Nonomuraea sp. C10]